MDMVTVLHYIAPILGGLTLLIGISAVLRPAAMSKNFGIAASADALPYVVSTGIRDVFIGLVFFILFFLQQWQAIALASLCVGIVAISDYLVVHKHGDQKKSLVHLSGAFAVLVYAAVLIFLS